MIKLKAFFPMVLLFALSFFAFKPLLSAGFFSMHDDQQIARLFELDKSLVSGQFPVRWVDGLGFGYGYPLFNFYPPLVYYLGEVYHLVLQTGFIDSTKLVWFTALLGSAITMYFLAKEFFGKLGALVAATFYLYAPYHAVDAYVRGALAELFSFVWLPLILLFASKKKMVLTGVLLALLMLTHNLIFLPFLGLFAVWSIFLKNYRFPLAILIALGLSSFFWLPAILEKQFTLVDSLLIKNLASYKIHFVCWPQLWDSPWGFGGSMAGCVDGISFKIGKLHVLAALLALPVGLLSPIIFLAFSLLAVSVFMTTDTSRLIWDYLNPLWYLQFPWRFLEFVVLFSSLLAGAIVVPIKSIFFKITAAGALVGLVILVQAKYFSPQTQFFGATDQELTSSQEIKWDVSSTSFEFMSKDISTKLTDKGVIWVDIDQSQIQNSKFKIQNGDWQTTQEKFLPDRFYLSGTSRRGATLQFQISNFPGWEIRLDKKPSEINDNNKYRLLSLSIPSGEHEIAGQFTNTPVRTVGNTVSSLSAILVLGSIFFYGTHRNRT